VLPIVAEAGAGALVRNKPRFGPLVVAVFAKEAADILPRLLKKLELVVPAGLGGSAGLFNKLVVVVGKSDRAEAPEAGAVDK